MTIPMPALTRAKNGDWFARKVIPSEVRDAYQRAYGVRQEERFRLTTDKPAGEAKAAYAEWIADIENRIAALRSVSSGSPIELTHRQMHELIGRWYDWFILQHANDDVPVEVWDHHYERYEDAAMATGSLDHHEEDDKPRSPRHAAKVRAIVLELSRLPTFLAEEGVRLSHEAHDQLVDTLEPDLVAAMALLRRRASGDYRPDTHRERFPQAAKIIPANAKLTGWDAWEAFEAWVKERKPQQSTVNRWRGVFDHLNKHTEGRDVALVTGEDAIGWKDTLVGGEASGQTINSVWLTAAGTVFNWVKSQKKITTNPFEGVRVATSRGGNTKGEFTEEDAEAILKATLAPRSPRASPYLKAAIRWVPWLCAYTGSRPGEMTQLRKEDIEQHRDGFWMLHIRPEAGTVKGSVARTVVLHDHLVEQGFVTFVQEAKPGPIFYDPKASGSKVTDDDPLNPVRPMYVLVRQKLADWVRKLGVTDTGVSPNHGWRHTFKRRAARAKIEQRLRDAFCGHTPANVGSIYERPTVEDLAEAIKDFPRYPVDAPKP
jgi:integrase